MRPNVKLMGAAALATIAGLVLSLALLLGARIAMADSSRLVWSAQGANAQATVDTRGYWDAQVTIWGSSGTPDGTVTVYADDGSDAPVVALASYPTPTAAKKFAGKPGLALRIVLSGNTTGTVGVKVVLK
jgi:hypothetical protein